MFEMFQWSAGDYNRHERAEDAWSTYGPMVDSPEGLWSSYIRASMTPSEWASLTREQQEAIHSYIGSTDAPGRLEGFQERFDITPDWILEMEEANVEYVDELRDILDEWKANPHLRDLLSPAAESRMFVEGSRGLAVSAKAAKDASAETAARLGLGRGHVAKAERDIDIARGGQQAALRAQAAQAFRQANVDYATTISEGRSDIETAELTGQLNVAQAKGQWAQHQEEMVAAREAARQQQQAGRYGLLGRLAGAGVAIAGAATGNPWLAAGGMALAGAGGGAAVPTAAPASAPPVQFGVPAGLSLGGGAPPAGTWIGHGGSYNAPRGAFDMFGGAGMPVNQNRWMWGY